MSRYIDADKFIDWLDVGHLRPPYELCFSNGDVKDMIDQRPTADVVEVVRCKDCIHHKEQKRRNGIAIYECDFISGLFLDDDFCSRGERKEQEG